MFHRISICHGRFRKEEKKYCYFAVFVHIEIESNRRCKRTFRLRARNVNYFCRNFWQDRNEWKSLYDFIAVEYFMRLNSYFIKSSRWGRTCSHFREYNFFSILGCILEGINTWKKYTAFKCIVLRISFSSKYKYLLRYTKPMSTFQVKTRRERKKKCKQHYILSSYIFK